MPSQRTTSGCEETTNRIPLYLEREPPFLACRGCSGKWGRRVARRTHSLRGTARWRGGGRASSRPGARVRSTPSRCLPGAPGPVGRNIKPVLQVGPGWEQGPRQLPAAKLGLGNGCKRGSKQGESGGRRPYTELPPFFLFWGADAKRASRVPPAALLMTRWGSGALASAGCCGHCYCRERLAREALEGENPEVGLCRGRTEEAGLIYRFASQQNPRYPGDLASRLIRQGWGDCNLGEVGSSRSQMRKRRETHVAESERGVVSGHRWGRLRSLRTGFEAPQAIQASPVLSSTLVPLHWWLTWPGALELRFKPSKPKAIGRW